MDQKPTKIHAAEEVEEPTEVSADHDQSWLQTPGGSKGLGQDEQMAIGGEDPGPLCYEP